MDRLQHVLFAALLTAATTLATTWLTRAESYSALPAAVAIPSLLVLVLLWRRIDRGESALVSRRFALFLAGYCALLGLLSSLDSLQWKERLVGYDEHLPANWLGLDRYGDWRYRVFPRPREATDMLVVLVPVHKEDGSTWARPELRHRLAGLIRQATLVGAKGVVLDFHFEVDTAMDDLLCASIQNARAKGVEVFAGFRHVELGGQLVRREVPRSLAACLPESSLGYLAGYWEPDNHVRRVPLFFNGDKGRASLSLLAARHLGGEVAVPHTGLLQYIEPRNKVSAVSGFLRGEDLERYRDRLIFVGSSSEHDLVPTPFGLRQGVEIHAAAAHALREGAYVYNAGTLLALPTIYAFCYLLVWLQARGGGVAALLRHAGWISLAIVVLAAAAAWVGVWIDVAFPILAIWGLVAIFLIHGRHSSFRASPTRLATESGFDVFLCHNSADKDSVRQLYAALVEKGIRPWLDEEELAPACDWQEAIEKTLRNVPSVAVMVGPRGIGPWAQQEMRAALTLAADRGLQVLPVLLPGASRKPDLPLFLQLRTWVDFRDGFSERGVNRLVWGITGRKPHAPRQGVAP